MNTSNSTFKRSGYYFIGLFLLAIAGFWNTYFSKFFSDIDSNTTKLSDVSYYVHFHASTMLLWIGLLIAQAFLIRLKKYFLHKFIGQLSYLLVPLIIISLLLLAHSQITVHKFGLSYSRLYLLFLQLSLLVTFIIAYSMAIVNRHSAARHARYMICTALTMIDPAVARLPLNLPSIPFSYQVWTFGLTDLILIILIVIERHQTKGREVFPIMLTIIIVFQGLNLTSTGSAIWDKFGLWFAKLPLT